MCIVHAAMYTSHFHRFDSSILYTFIVSKMDMTINRVVGLYLHQVFDPFIHAMLLR